MTKGYINTFLELARNNASTAEFVMEYYREKDNPTELANMTQIRDDYQELADKINTAGEGYILTKKDAAKLLIGAIIFSGQLRDKITNYQKALAGFQTKIIPTLQEIVDIEDEVTADRLASEKFIIEE